MAESVIRALRKRKLVKITLITVGKVKEKYLRDASRNIRNDWAGIASSASSKVADEKTPEHASDGLERQIKAKEGERIAKHIRDDAFVIALAIEGSSSPANSSPRKSTTSDSTAPAISSSSSAAHWDSTPRSSNEPTTC